jgi:hypothetical protein
VTLELTADLVCLFGEAEFEQADEDGGEGAGDWRFELGRYGYCWVREENGI